MRSGPAVKIEIKVVHTDVQGLVKQDLDVAGDVAEAIGGLTSMAAGVIEEAFAKHQVRTLVKDHEFESDGVTTRCTTTVAAAVNRDGSFVRDEDFCTRFRYSRILSYVDSLDEGQRADLRKALDKIERLTQADGAE